MTREFRPPQLYNAAADLLDRNLKSGRGGKIAVIDGRGSYTYSELAERVHRCANALRNLGIEAEQRVILCLLDTIDFPTCFLGAVAAGIVPIPLNTLCTAEDYAFILADARPKAAIVSEARKAVFQEAARLAGWGGRLIIAGEADGELSDLLAKAAASAQIAQTRPDDICFWLYSSGSTGEPKGVVHRHTSLIRTAELFGQGVLGLTESDVVYSAAKLFFAYGLGNALTFPMSVGATSILFSGRPTPEAVNAILRERRPTIFCGVPTLFNSLLASGGLARSGQHTLRLCTSAGEALPEHLGRAWREHTGVDIVDGIGSTEMLHIFVSNRPGAVRYGVTGRPVPGYRVRLVDDRGADVPPGEVGEMHVSGPTAAACYWNNADKTRATFLGEWVRTSDKFRQTPEGDFVYCGRRDEMLKVGGIWVSPMEVETVLMAHESVFEAAVVGAPDESGLVKPMAFVVLKPAAQSGPQLVEALQSFVKAHLAPYKYPRWIEFIDALPKTATGKIQRFLLQKRATEMRAGAGGR
ncbi:MAG TPA: benzoate-CoA ligase family protein [Bryobacteraceae bacterium]|nr:benzoate-CoA ligase family protein [Bryobacteraceae bacterium]